MTVSFNIHHALEFHARATPRRLAVESDTGNWTFDELWSGARRFAATLAGQGLGNGTRIAVLSKNRGEMLVMLFGAALAGAVLVPLNHRLAAPELDWIVRDSEARVVFFEEEFRPKLGPRQAAEIETLAHGTWWPASPANGKPYEADDAYLQIYTSGTTGNPKGVVLTQANAIAQQAAVSASLGVRIAPGDRLYQSLPLFHVGGVFMSLFGLFNGASLVLRRDFSPQDAIDRMSGQEPIHAVMVPTMIQACTALPLPDGHRFPALRTLMFGASPISIDLLQRAARRFGCDLAQVYGMTETHSVISALNPEDYRLAFSGGRPAILAAAGRPVAGTELRILDADGKALLAGEVGEIVVRSGHVMAGYWHRPQDTADTLQGGFLHTGDAGRLDEDGYLYVVDRIKDIIVSGGENISSLDVENVLAAHPMVAEAAVIGVPHPHWGEAVQAIVVAKNETSPCADEILAFCRERLAGFKVPRGVEFVAALPRNGAGKVLKRALREPFWRGQERRVG
ncbi:long-chain-fatty-acid--CoA ligase [Oleomonas cavernae]|nr:long-chain-fatty-acid--CoA ligase [Oleomonas cavernae]